MTPWPWIASFGAPIDATTAHYFSYGDDLERPPCAQERVGIALLRGYRMTFRGDADATVVSLEGIRSDATVPGVLWTIDPTCVAQTQSQSAHTQVYVEHAGANAIPAITHGAPPTAMPHAPSQPYAASLLQTWVANGLRPLALLDALPAELSHGWAGPGRVEVSKHLHTATFLFSLSGPTSSPASGLRSVSLSLQDGLREPDAVGADGQPISATVHIAPQQALSTLALLGAFDVFDGTWYVEPRVPEPGAVPSGAATKAPTPPREPHVSVQIVVNDEVWYHRVDTTWPWSSGTRTRLQHIAQAVGGDAAQTLGKLSEPLPQ
jgi:hypothetical protein